MTLVIIDYNRTIYDPETDTLIEGAEALLNELARRESTVVLVSRNEGTRMAVIDRLGIKRLFAEIVFAESKTHEVFTQIMDRYGATPAETFVIGDYLHQEIRAGNSVGACTIHYKQGRFADLLPETPADVPNAVITSLDEALPLVT